MKRVYIGNKELTTIATVTNGGGGGGDDTQKWVDYFNGTLTEFTVPEGVTKINTATFYSFTGLTSLTLPSSITSIEKAEMMGMHGGTNPFGTLKAMTVKATTPPTILGYGAIIPDTIETIYVPAASVDSYKSANKWNDYDDKIQAIAQNETVVIYNDGTSKEFSIIGELTKDKIENITDATKVYVGNSVTSIGNTVFWGNSSITTIVIPSSVKTIGFAAFRESNITSIIIPDGTTKIEDSMCWMCPKLKFAIIPASITSIEPQTFRECPNLTSVTIKNSNSKLAYSRQAFEGISSSAILFVPSNLLSDYQADTDWTGAFKGGIYEIGTSMKVTYTDGTEKTFYDLTTIKSDTDSNKKNAKNVVIYYGVKKIDQEAFSYCTGLTNVEISDSVTNIEFRAFACSGLTSITIPDSVTKFGDSVLQHNPDLESVTLGSGINSLGVYVCYNCPKLASVTIRNSKNKITYGRGTFEDTPSSKKLYVPSNLLADYQSDSNWTGAFGGGIFAIKTPAMKVTYVDGTEKKFYGLSSIEENTDANKKNAKEVEIYDSVIEIGNFAFRDCYSLTSVTIPDSVKSIDYDAFANCTSLTSVTLPNGLTSIGDSAFRNCIGFKTITIPDSVTSIGNKAFYYCSNLTGITIPNSVTSIGEQAFYSCSSLTSITIPESVTSIGTYAFYDCSKLESVTIQNSSSKLAYNTDVFGAISSTAKLYVPSNLLADYQADSAWTEAFKGGIYAIQ